MLLKYVIKLNQSQREGLKGTYLYCNEKEGLEEALYLDCNTYWIFYICIFIYSHLFYTCVFPSLRKYAIAYY